LPDIKPLFCILSPRLFPELEEKVEKINYLDKLWIKYYPEREAHEYALQYFLKHTEYTHLIINCDDGVPEYEHIAMLIADVKKYDFPVVAGCCCLDKSKNDMRLNLTTERLTGTISDDNALRPNEFRESGGLVKVWYQGNSVCMIRRDIVELIEKWGAWSTGDPEDLSQASFLACQNIPQYVDLRCYFEHSRNYKDGKAQNLLVGIEPKYTKFEETTEQVPEMPPAELIEKKLCIVSPYLKDFRWAIALSKYLHVTYLHCTMWDRNIPEYDAYWNPIREADVVYVYAVRCFWADEEWWNLPRFIKKFMKPEAKMIAQWDDEFVWAFHPNWKWWDNKEVKDQEPPEQFFERTKILEVPDAHLAVISNPLYKPFLKRPFYKLSLPHFLYHNFNYPRMIHGPNVAMIVHSPFSAKINNTLENVIIPNDISVTVFTSYLDGVPIELRLENLPKNSNVFNFRMPEDAFMHFLSECSIAIDDNEGYFGWSRFTMECALLYIPCIGSTEAVQDFFPELYTEHNDYAKQLELINKLKNDKEFYERVVISGHERCLKLLNTDNLCKQFIDIVNELLKTNIHLQSREFKVEDVFKIPNETPRNRAIQEHEKIVKSGLREQLFIENRLREEEEKQRKELRNRNEKKGEQK
jgi:hypothetical protein